MLRCHLLVGSRPVGFGRATARLRRFGPGPVAAHPVAVAVDVDDDAAVQQTVQHRAGDHRVVVEDLAPARDPEVGRQGDAALQVSPAHNLEQGRGCLARKGKIANFVDLCGHRHRSTYAESATMPTTQALGTESLKMVGFSRRPVEDGSA